MQRLFAAFAMALALSSLPALAVVNINTASQEEFVALHKGLGPAKAQAIIDYRKAHGPFKSVDDLKHVKGIGAKRLEKLRADLTVGPRRQGRRRKPCQGRSRKRLLRCQGRHTPGGRCRQEVAPQRQSLQLIATTGRAAQAVFPAAGRNCLAEAAVNP